MKNNNLSFEKILIDGEYIEIPFAIFNKTKRKTILITAGLDGDEYAGIKAAYKFINDFNKFNFKYKVIVIPLLNIFGNKAGVSFNPRDGKYPKYIYPGKPNGTSSEQLMFYLEKYIKKCFLWIDLHSGSKDEMLEPFIWAWETKNKNINDLTVSILSRFKNEIIIYQKKSIRKINELSKINVSYLMLESGELGKEENKSIEKHLYWIKKILAKNKANNNILVYRNVKFIQASRSGKWQQKISSRKTIKGDLLGNIDGKEINSSGGIILYNKKTMFVKKRDELLAIAQDSELI